MSDIFDSVGTHMPTCGAQVTHTPPHTCTHTPQHTYTPAHIHPSTHTHPRTCTHTPQHTYTPPHMHTYTPAHLTKHALTFFALFQGNSYTYCMYSVLCTVYCVLCTVCTVYCVLCTVYCMYSVLCTVEEVQNAVAIFTRFVEKSVFMLQ